MALPSAAGLIGKLPNPAGVSRTFLELTDTPATYAGANLSDVRVNVGATALVFVTYPGDPEMALGGGVDALIGGVSLSTPALAPGAAAIAIGVSSNARGVASITIGDGANISASAGLAAIAIGRNAVVGNHAGGIAIGDGAATTGPDTTRSRIAIGELSSADNLNTIAFGGQASATRLNALALGFIATATGTNSTALGFDANASATSAVALGDQAIAAHVDAVALGAEATTQEAGQLAYQGLSIIWKKENLSFAAVASNTTAIDVPAGAILLGVTTKVSTTFAVSAGNAPDDILVVWTAGAATMPDPSVIGGGGIPTKNTNHEEDIYSGVVANVASTLTLTVRDAADAPLIDANMNAGAVEVWIAYRNPLEIPDFA